MTDFIQLNLQLFATPATLGGTTIETTTLDNSNSIANSGPGDLSPEMKTFYSKDLIETAGPALLHAQFGDKVALGKNHGKKIEWRKFSKFAKALTPLTEGVTPTGHTLEVTKIEKELCQYGDYSIISDLLDMTAIDPIVVEYTQRHAENAAATLDTLVRNELLTGTNVRYGQILVGDVPTYATSRAALTAYSRLTMEVIASAVADLTRQNAPKIDGSYVAIVHPSVAKDIMTSSDWIDINKYSNATKIFEGEIGKLYGVRFIQTTEAKVYPYVAAGTDGANTTQMVYCTLFLGKGAYKVTTLDGNNMEMYVKNRGSSGTSDPLDQRSTIGWKTNGYGAAITIPEYLVRVETTASFNELSAAN